MKKNLLITLTVLCVLGIPGLGITTAVVQAQPVIFVDADATGANNGASWNDAFTDLHLALQTAQFGAEVWVAEGIYKPVVPANPPAVTVQERGRSFRVLDGVSVFGGFSGTETLRDERDIAAHVTFLSGDLLGNDNETIDINEPTRADNTFRIVKMGDIDLGPVGELTVLDGFTITGGNANPPDFISDNAGAGVNVIGFTNATSKPMIRNVIFVANSAVFGGGLGCFVASPSLQNVAFTNNSASQDGGGMSTFTCSATLRGVIFRDNAAGDLGGGMINNRGSSTLFGVSFVGNTAEFGGGVYNLKDVSLFVNTFFASNEALAGGGMYNDESNPDVMNSVFSGNRALDNTLRGGGGMYNFRGIPFVTNSVFYGNISANEGGAIFNNTSDPFLLNSILWDNQSAGQENEIFDGGIAGSSTFVAASIVDGGVPASAINGAGNLIGNPFFVNPSGADNIPGTLDDNFRLSPTSPAIDTGEIQFLLFDVLDLDDDGDIGETIPVDFDGNARIFNQTGLALARVDMGAYEFGAPAILVGVENDTGALPVIPVLVDAYPNPFRDHATLRYELKASGHVLLKVYDLLGREVATMVDGVLPAGTHTAQFSAPGLASGMYIFRLDIAGTTITKKMTLVR